MKWTAYNKDGRLTWFGMPLWAETCLNCLVGGIIVTSFLVFSGCEEAQSQSPALVGGKYRIFQIYGVQGQYPCNTSYADYYSDDVTYDGPWIKFYDKNRKLRTRLSGNILVEGGDN